PRDELLRGRFNKAIPELVEARALCQDARNRLSQEKQLPKELSEWLSRAFDAYAEQQLAAGNPVRQDEANQKLESLWREARALSILLVGTRAVPQRREVVYHLGLRKHEEAERKQLQAELTPEDTAQAQRAVDAWKEAVNVWQQFLDEYGAQSSAGAAVRMLGRARLLSGDREQALRTWRQEVPTIDLEKLGNL